MTTDTLSAAARRRLAKAILEDRFVGDDLRAEPLESLVHRLLYFEPGPVPPRSPQHARAGVPMAGPVLDHEFQQALGEPTRRRWPNDAPMAIAITHDVDLFDGLSYFGLRAAGWAAAGARSLIRGDLDAVARTARRANQWTRWWARGVDPVEDISAWQALEAEHGVRSTFFFLSLVEALSKEGRLYRADDPRVRRVLRSLHEGGWEVGLHASRYGSGDALGLEQQRVRLENALGAAVTSIRYHYLTASFPEAWRQMADAGFTTSSNVGFSPPFQGFRTGTAWPYRPLAHQGHDLVEVPMALMDVAHGPARGELSNMFDWLCAETGQVGGVLVINFHTNYVADIDAPAVHAQFKDILGQVANLVERGEACCLTMAQVADHLRRSSQPAAPGGDG